MSSNAYAVIRALLDFFFFLQKDFTCTKSIKKHKKAQKSIKSTKSTKMEISDFHLDAHKKHKKVKNT